MKIRTIGRHVREGLKSLGRNGWMSFASISAMTVTLLILGVFLVLAINVNHISNSIESQVEVDVMVKNDVTGQALSDLQTTIQGFPHVQSVSFISKEQGLQILRQRLGQNADLLNGLDSQNPLPNKFIVKADNASYSDGIAADIQKLPQVDKVIYGKETVDKLLTFTKIVRNVGLAFVIGLMLTAMFLISNTIKITIFARRREIEIMKLVGATNGFIRWPFFVEGVMIGVFGALIPGALISIGYTYLVRHVNADYLAIFNLLPANPLVTQVLGVLIVIGIVVGMWGSILSVRRFLKV
ncbi:permease-like cell division protein FtsX [Fodinisporobacter ferrooxydans]|uniref:Cell division protein FtsX n=1 Tax=Fodinisporobacter ferrooxydans TaxID=2901836 RepID=A0ABY4CPI6_9BACL|nr:permease-like cell division protein FtsX [Alicyclobacillaceae bacterium MYW30-H2]